MKYQREIRLTLHDYTIYKSNKKHRKRDDKWLSRFLAIHERMGTRYYIDTLRHLIYTYEKVLAQSVDISVPPSFYDDEEIE